MGSRNQEAAINRKRSNPKPKPAQRMCPTHTISARISVRRPALQARFDNGWDGIISFWEAVNELERNYYNVDTLSLSLVY